MNDFDFEVYAPNFHSFTFKVHTGIDKNLQTISCDRKWILDTYNPIVEQLGDFPRDTIKLREDTPKNTPFSLLDYRKNARLFDSDNGNLESNKPRRKSLVYPQQFDDSYSLSLDLFIPETPETDKINREKIKQFNPNNCFQIDTELGQTFLITAFLEENNSQNYEKIANYCLHELLSISLEEIETKLYRQGEIFDSNILEYGYPKEDEFHAVVVFFTDKSNSEKLEEVYWELPSLFLYHHKIINAYADSRLDYHKLDNQVAKIENLVSSIKKQDNTKNSQLSELELDNYKDTLKELLNLSLDYSQTLRNLQYYQNTIAINSHNYQIKLNKIQTISNNDLDFFARLIDKEWITLQEPIKADLSYFNQGNIILNRGIETIRGLIEIDQAKSDRLREQKEIERDRNLQINILAIGSSLTVAGIVASSYGLVTAEKPLLPPEFYHPFRSVSPFYKSVFLSIACAIITYILIRIFQKIFRFLKKILNILIRKIQKIS